MDIKRKQKQEDWLDNSSLQDIADSIDREIEKIKYKYVDDDYTQSHQAGDGVLDLINSLKEKPEVGVPLFGPLINSVTRGARLRKFYLRSAPTGCGKALPNDSLVPTPDGWKKVKDVQVGSFLFDRLGNPTRVIGKFPQPKPLDSYKIETRDGRIVYSSLDHLWTYYEGKTKRTETLEKLIQRLNNPKRTQPISFPTNGPVEFKENKDLISPFVAGRAIAKILTYRNRYKSFEQSSVVRKVYTLEPIEQRFVSEYPSMDQVPYIPDEYINCSRKQRLEFLKGMQMGFGGREDAFLIPYVSDNLEHSLRRMAWSLGMDVEVCGRYFSGKRVSTVRFVKQDSSYLEVLRVTKTGRQEEMTCFRVDNAESLFLMEDFLVTHNTRSLIADACNFACNKIYDDNFGWIKNGVSQPTLFIATEQDKSEVQTMMLAFLSNVNEEHILNGKYLPDEEERVIQAGQILMESPLWVEYLPDFSLQDVENKIKKNVREHNVAYVLFDYVHVSMKILEEITKRSGGVRLREDNVLFMLATRLKDLANQYGIFILSATQLNAQYVDSETPDQNLLRGTECALIHLIRFANGVLYRANGKT